jgi:hypothetical protein
VRHLILLPAFVVAAALAVALCNPDPKPPPREGVESFAPVTNRGVIGIGGARIVCNMDETPARCAVELPPVTIDATVPVEDGCRCEAGGGWSCRREP